MEREGAAAELLEYFGSTEVRLPSSSCARLRAQRSYCLIIVVIAPHPHPLYAWQLLNARFNRLCEEKRCYDGIVRSLGIDSSTVVCVGSGFMGNAKGRGKSRISGPVKVPL